MATKAERFHAEEQKNHPRKPKKTQRSTPGRKTRVSKHAAKKASYAAEPPRTASRRPSRKSSRKSANRSKPDTNLNLREERQKGSAESRFRKDRVKGTRVRGTKKKA